MHQRVCSAIESPPTLLILRALPPNPSSIIFISLPQMYIICMPYPYPSFIISYSKAHRPSLSGEVVSKPNLSNLKPVSLWSQSNKEGWQDYSLSQNVGALNVFRGSKRIKYTFRVELAKN